MKNAVEQEG